MFLAFSSTAVIQNPPLQGNGLKVKLVLRFPTTPLTPREHWHALAAELALFCFTAQENHPLRTG